MLKSIAVMTSGGDSPGMNAAARAVVRTALFEGVTVWGINNGYKGLFDEDMFKMESKDVGDIIQRGGTFLGTARCKEFETPEGRTVAYQKLVDRGIEGLVVIGGDGSLRGAQKLSAEHGIPIVGLPGSIDNDVWGTDYTIGSDTAANTIIDAMNKLRDTASAHRRVAVLEVMGRRCGWLAMIAGIAGGAEYILVPEEEYDIDAIVANLRLLKPRSKKQEAIINQRISIIQSLHEVVKDRKSSDFLETLVPHNELERLVYSYYQALNAQVLGNEEKVQEHFLLLSKLDDDFYYVREAKKYLEEKKYV